VIFKVECSTYSGYFHILGLTFVFNYPHCFSLPLLQILYSSQHVQKISIQANEIYEITKKASGKDL
jgi:hypothetical protein